MEIPLKRKYLVHKPVKMCKSKHNDGAKKRPGYSKGKRGGVINHVPWVMVLLPSGKRRFMPQAEWDASRATDAA